MARRWTQEECDYLEDSWGARSVGVIAKRLGRTTDSVRKKAKRLRCGRFLDAADGISVNLLFKTIYKQDGSGSGHYWIGKWVSNGLPVFRKRICEKVVRMVRMEKFWKWAEEHQGLIDFSQLEKNELGPEPRWMKEKRKVDGQKNIMQYRPWGRYEESTLRDLCFAGRPWREFPERLPGRSEGAIQTHIRDLGLKVPEMEHNRRRWTQEEKDVLLEMHGCGYCMDAVAHRLQRSTKSCYAKLEDLKGSAKHGYERR